jgi:hypothetical protein
MANFNAVTVGWTPMKNTICCVKNWMVRLPKYWQAWICIDKLVAALEKHYIDERSEWVAKLRDIKQDPGESLGDLAFRISLYSKQAYGTLQPDLGLQLYLALKDGPLGDKHFEHKDRSLLDVLQHVKSYEVVFERNKFEPVAAMAHEMETTEAESGITTYGRGLFFQGRGRGRGCDRGQFYNGSGPQ